MFAQVTIKLLLHVVALSPDGQNPSVVKADHAADRLTMHTMISPRSDVQLGDLWDE